MDKKIIVVIPARGGSKRFPGKNLYPFMGKPLIAHPIEAARGAKLVDRVIVSTDDEEIIKTAKQYGAEVPFLRPADLAQDTSMVVTTIKHAVETLSENENYHADYTVLLQPTTPIISAEQIDEAVQLAFDRDANSVIAISKVETVNHPYNVREMLSDGTVKFWQEDLHYSCVGKDLPYFYRAANLWLSSRKTLLEEGRLESSTKNYPIIVPEINSSDIDYLEDLERIEAIIRYMEQKSVC